MGLVFPIALILVALAALVFAGAIVKSWFVKNDPAEQHLYWRRSLTVTMALVCLPALVSSVELVGDWKMGYYSWPPLILLLSSILPPAGLGIYVVKARSAEKKAALARVEQLKVEI